MPQTPSPRRVIWSRIFLAAASLLILALTLWPGSGESGSHLGFWCVLCGTRGLADGVLNVILFVPVGIAIGLRFGPVLGLACVAAVSGFVEGVQLWIPGRYSTFGDLLFNTAGGAWGAVLATHWELILRRLSHPPPSLRISATLLPLTVFVLSAFLSAPAYPGRPYFGQWTHDLGKVRPYPGRVISADVGGLPVPDARLNPETGVREALRHRAPIHLSFRTGPAPEELSHLFAIYDDLRREVLFLGVQGTDLQFQRRVVGEALKLDQPFLRWPGILPENAGVLVRVTVRQTGKTLCFQVDSQVRCDVAPGVEQGWRLLHRLSAAGPLSTWMFSFLWIWTLSFPAGLAASTTRGAFWLGLTIGGVGAIISWMVPWMSPHTVMLLAPVAGTWSSLEARRLLRSRYRDCGLTKGLEGGGTPGGPRH